MIVPVIGVIDINQTTWRQFGCFVAPPPPGSSPRDRQVLSAFVPRELGFPRANSHCRLVF